MLKKTLSISSSIQNNPIKMVYFLAQLHTFSILHKISFIVYRLPQIKLEKPIQAKQKPSEPFTVIFSRQWSPPSLSPNAFTFSKLNQSKEFFIFHPHQASYPTSDQISEHHWGHFKADFIYSPIRGTLKVNSPSHLELTTNLVSSINQTIKTLNKSSFHDITSISSTNFTPFSTPPLQKKSTLKKEFIQQVNTTIQQLNQPKTKLKKVVLSKIKLLRIVSSNQSTTLAKCFVGLLNDPNFKNTLTSLVISPEIGCWMGASPEILASQDKKGIFTTVSLAGTKTTTVKTSNSNQKSVNNRFKNITWSEKEIEEQADVSRFIIDTFKKIRLREYKEDGPRTIKTGHLAHLKSIFTVNTKKYFGPRLLYKMASLLHPTSAICGTPRLMAHQLIDKLEKHERRFYSGLLGPMPIDRESHLFVNLRCVEIGEKKVCLYSGAGITSLSDSVDEWEETENKIKVMQQFFKKNYG